MGYTVTDNHSDYDRGVAAGEIAERLREHDNHFLRINGSLHDMTGELVKVNLTLQGIADSAVADRAIVVATAKALKEANEARREQDKDVSEARHEQETARWAPWQKVLAVAAILVPLAALVAYIIIAGKA